jgi:putative aldouronate transport system permease protein
MASNSLTVTFEDKIIYAVNGIILGVIFLVTLYPIVFVFSASFSSPEAVTTGKVVLWPVDLSLEGYEAVFRTDSVLRGYYNSLIYTVVGTAINVTITILAAFPLSRKELVGFKTINFLFVFTMWFSGGMIPTYLLIKNLGMLNTRWAMWIPGAIGVWNIMITRTFFQNSIPDELFQSASIDGCGYLRFLREIVLPLSGAIIAVITLFYAVGHWNAYFNAFLYLNDPDLFPLQLVLREILVRNQMDMEMMTEDAAADFEAGLQDLLKYSLIMVACVPVWLIYPFVQRFFVKGVMLGSIKG